MVEKSVRDVVVERMPAPLLNKLAVVEQQIQAQRDGTIQWYYKLGKTVQAVKEDGDRYRGTDGTDGLELLLEAVAKHASTVTTALRFFENFSTEDLQWLLDLKNAKTGVGLTWSHIPILLTCATKTERKKWASRAVREELTAPALHAEIKAAKEDPNSGHGRPFAVPVTVEKQIRSLIKELARMQRLHDQLWNGEAHSIFRELSNMEDSELDDAMLSYAEQMLEASSKLAGELQVISELSDAAVTRISDTLKAREEDATEARSGVAAAVEASGTRASRAIEQDADTPVDPPPTRRSRSASAVPA